MTASAEPAACMRLEMSGMPELRASCRDFCEFRVFRDIPEMAESIDDVRGIVRVSGRTTELRRGGDAVE